MAARACSTSSPSCTSDRHKVNSSSPESTLIILKWFYEGRITTASTCNSDDTCDGFEIEGTQMNMRVRHNVVRKLYATKFVATKTKRECRLGAR